MSDSEVTSEGIRRWPSAILGRLNRLVRRRLPAEDTLTEAIRDTVEDNGAIDGARKDMILKAAGFDRLRVEDVMRPRADIVAIDMAASLAEASRLFSESQHSRLPVYRDNLDDPQGFVHVRDVMAVMSHGDDGAVRAKPSDRVLSRVKREILYVPPSMKLSSLLLKMQSTRIHLALVVDEYGGTDGLVSMEDIVEQIVGEIDDEHDVESPLIQERPAGAFEADGRADIGKLASRLKLDLAMPDHEDEFDTAAGLAVALAGRVPQRGEILRHPAGLDIEVIDADPRRVKRLRFIPAAPRPAVLDAATDTAPYSAAPQPTKPPTAAIIAAPAK
jgi:CBS domain containing-hemolysin-like protein